MIDFREIRAWVPAQDAVRFYGAKFDHRGWAICPFHGDTHPSISFKNGRFRCWSCGASGDALDYVSRLFDLDSVQAGQKLDADFHLGLSREHIDAREMERQETERRAIAGLHERFETWRGKTIDRLNEVCYIAHTSLKRLPAPLSDREALAVRFSARAGKVNRYGVFYPMQTFSKQRTVDFRQIPVFVESNSAADTQTLKDIASVLSEKVYEATSEQRKSLHLAAVFTCNFTNHMYALAAELLKKYQLPFEVMLPLIDETARKVHELEPRLAQTGPAIRYDENVINNHLQMLSDEPGMQELYRLISESIHQQNS